MPKGMAKPATQLGDPEVGRLLFDLRTGKGWMQKYVADMIGTKDRYYGKFERAERPVSRKFALRLGKLYGVPADRFLREPGETVASERVTGPTDALIPEHHVVNRKKGPAATRDDPLPVLGGSMASSAEYPYALNDQKVTEYKERPAKLAGVVDAFALYMIGSTMEPRYYQGELLYIHPHLPAQPNDFVLVRFVDGRGTVKQYIGRENGHVIVRQFNPAKDYRLAEAEVAALEPIVQAGKP